VTPSTPSAWRRTAAPGRDVWSQQLDVFAAGHTLAGKGLCRASTDIERGPVGEDSCEVPATLHSEIACELLIRDRQSAVMSAAWGVCDTPILSGGVKYYLFWKYH